LLPAAVWALVPQPPSTPTTRSPCSAPRNGGNTRNLTKSCMLR
jgi:hypothetical protein